MKFALIGVVTLFLVSLMLTFIIERTNIDMNTLVIIGTIVSILIILIIDMKLHTIDKINRAIAKLTGFEKEL